MVGGFSRYTPLSLADLGSAQPEDEAALKAAAAAPQKLADPKQKATALVKDPGVLRRRKHGGSLWSSSTGKMDVFGIHVLLTPQKNRR